MNAMNKPLVSRSNLSKLPDGKLWGSTDFNATPVYFLQKSTEGDAVTHFTLETHGRGVGTAKLNIVVPKDERADFVDSGEPVGTMSVKFATFSEVIEYNVYARRAVSSGKVVLVLRNQRRDPVETQDAF